MYTSNGGQSLSLKSKTSWGAREHGCKIGFIVQRICMEIDNSMSRIQSHLDLDEYKLAFASAMRIFEVSKQFPKDETYSLTDQIRRSSRSVCANTAEGWRKRRYEAAFINKLTDAEAEAAETQTWLEFAYECEYLTVEVMKELRETYDHVIGKLVKMIINPTPWILPR